LGREVAETTLGEQIRELFLGFDISLYTKMWNFYTSLVWGWEQMDGCKTK
jgi:hypothetical protein